MTKSDKLTNALYAIVSSARIAVRAIPVARSTQAHSPRQRGSGQTPERIFAPIQVAERARSLAPSPTIKVGAYSKVRLPRTACSL